MSAAYVIGADPGVSGAIAILTADGELVAVHDMPVFAVERRAAGKTKTKRHVNAYELSALLAPYSGGRVMKEQVGAMRHDGVSSAFQFGKADGVLEGVIGAHEFRMETVRPQEWKKHFRITADKDQARLLAVRRWPAMAEFFKRKLDAGRAEAALIGLYAIESARVAA